MTDATTFDEATLILQAHQGDRAAFGQLVKAYQKKAYAMAYGFVGNREDALELAQEAFVRAFRAMSRFDPGMPFHPWLYRIVKNTCLNHIRRRGRRRETSLDAMTESGFDVASPTGEPDHQAELADLRRSIAEALEQLTPDHKEIIVLRHVHELSYGEIALYLDVPQGTVMSRLHAARKSLRHALEALGPARP